MGSTLAKISTEIPPTVVLAEILALIAKHVSLAPVRHVPWAKTACTSTTSPNFCTVVDNDRDDCGTCGTVACTPAITTIPIANMPAHIPADAKVSCHADNTATASADCPMLTCGDRTFWALSYLDNDGALNVVGYDSPGNIVTTIRAPGTRYLWQITLDPTLETATFFGQDVGTAILPWSTFR